MRRISSPTSPSPNSSTTVATPGHFARRPSQARTMRRPARSGSACPDRPRLWSPLRLAPGSAFRRPCRVAPYMFLRHRPPCRSPASAATPGHFRSRAVSSRTARRTTPFAPARPARSARARSLGSRFPVSPAAHRWGGAGSCHAPGAPRSGRDIRGRGSALGAHGHQELVQEAAPLRS